MRISESLLFAPGIRFIDLDINGNTLPDQFEIRLRAFYLEPAALLAASSNAFASGLILLGCIDALSRFDSENDKVERRFKEWVKKNLRSFHDEEFADHLYKQFRNGLVHEARIKEGGEFNLEQDAVVQRNSLSLSINPMLLYDEVSEALSNFVQQLKDSSDLLDEFSKRLRSEFSVELADVEYLLLNSHNHSMEPWKYTRIIDGPEIRASLPGVGV